MEKKYRILYDNSMTYTDKYTKEEKTVYQIEAVRDFLLVSKGDKGGYVENEMNLSQEGDCWVFDDAIVASGSLVAGNSLVHGSSRVMNGSRMFDNAVLKDAEIENTLMGKNCDIETAIIENCTFYQDVYIDGGIVKNVTAWNMNVIESDVDIRKTHLWISSACEIYDSKFIHKSKQRNFCIEHSLKIHNSQLREVQLFTLKSPIHIKNIDIPHLLKISTLKNDTDGYENKLYANESLTFKKGTRIVLRESSIQLDGHLSGYLRFDRSKVEAIGFIENKNHKCLSLTNIKMKELSRLTNHNETHIENLVLQGEYHYTC